MSGNGGYVAGIVANAIDGCAEVTLKAPPPLDTAMAIKRFDDGVSLVSGDVEYAIGKKSDLDLDPPKPPCADEIAAAAARYEDHGPSDFSGCFVCGRDREPGDGLRIYAGALNSDGRSVAAPWKVPETLDLIDGRVAPEYVWAAMDCPGAYTLWNHNDDVSPNTLLGRMTAEICQAPKPGDACAIMGWYLESDGRKHYAGTAAFGPDGALLGLAKQVWIELKA